MVKCEERKRDERDKRDGRDQAEQKVQKEKRDKELRALRLFRDVLVLKTFVGFGGVLHGLLCDEPTFNWANSVQDVLETNHFQPLAEQRLWALEVSCMVSSVTNPLLTGRTQCKMC